MTCRVLYVFQHLAAILHKILLGVDLITDLRHSAVDKHASRADLILGGTAREHAAIGEKFLQSDIRKNPPRSPPQKLTTFRLLSNAA